MVKNEVQMRVVDKMYDNLIDFGVATEQELILVTKLMGYDYEVLQMVLHVRTGYTSITDYLENGRSKNEQVIGGGK